MLILYLSYFITTVNNIIDEINMSVIHICILDYDFTYLNNEWLQNVIINLLLSIMVEEN